MKIQSVRFFESVLLQTVAASSETREVTFIGPLQGKDYGWEVHVEADPVPHIAIRSAAGDTFQCVPMSNVKHWQPEPRIVAVVSMPAPALEALQTSPQVPRKRKYVAET